MIIKKFHDDDACLYTEFTPEFVNSTLEIHVTRMF